MIQQQVLLLVLLLFVISIPVVLVNAFSVSASASSSSSSNNNSNDIQSSSSSSSSRQLLQLPEDQIPEQPNIRNVLIVGGTHGNEYTGVWCIKSFEQTYNNNNNNNNKDTTTYDTLSISTLIGNPKAVKENKRFINTDLNREFNINKLNNNENNDTNNNVEIQRAKELHEIYGPKHTPALDLIIDLHTTTSNMGLTIIVGEGDIHMCAVAAYIISQYNNQNKDNTNRNIKSQILMHNQHDRYNRINLSSLGKHGITIEVGPISQGILKHDIVEITTFALHTALYCINTMNTSYNNNNKKLWNELYNYYYYNNCNNNNNNAAYVPCYKSAHAIRDGEISGKITWPTFTEYPNFPLYMIHKDRQDRDFELIHIGDPLFVTLDGTIIPYDGSHGDNVYLMFINEGGYYYKASGTGISVAIKTSYNILTGRFINEQDEQDIDDDIYE